MKRDNKVEAKLVDGSKLSFGIVVARFNEDITGGMLKGALATLVANGVKAKNIKTFWVPGAFEIPLRVQQLAQSKKYDGLIALGCVIKGDTDHYYYVAGEAIRGVMEVMLKTGLPIGMGIITTENLKQAQARSGQDNNKGSEAAQATLEMIGQ